MPVRPEDHFSPDYGGARRRFRQAAEARGAELESHGIRARSPAGEELSIDVAYLGPQAPESLLAVSSGLHGVEGFAGSAIQHQLLTGQLDGLALAPGCGLLLVHALNPFGFSALRRVNETNVDLNRNFLAHPEEHVANPGYEELYAVINPEALDDEREERSRETLFAYGRQHGMVALQAVLTVGQYVHPEGVQFGGQCEEESTRLLREIAVRARRGARRVVWIDVHTGLGAWAEVEMISEAHPEEAEYQRARRFFGDRVRSTLTGESVSAHVCGSIERGLAQALPECELTAVAAEFGTHDPIRVFGAMRADNWLHVHGELESARGAAIKRELLEVFRPDDPAWSRRVLEVGAEVVECAAAGVSGA